MRKWAFCLLLPLLLTGCGAVQEPVPDLTRVVLERGHGSMWGNQFYMDVCAGEILQTRYFPPNAPGTELTEESGRPITSEQWTEIVSAVDALEPTLVRLRETLWQKLFDSKALDGTEFHRLTLYWAEDEGTSYEWPDNEQAAALEALLEQLVLKADEE